ncbi:MAG: alkaline phosphatase family protein [Hirschia sp.]|nr:alkaline phosphatase family protein [Hirschia sp.]MBF17108.1 alkaline phosphatase family protein [Hirschia sp.]
MKMMNPIAMVLVAIALAACATTSGEPVSESATHQTVAEQAEPVTILISIDGFHPDYLATGLTPTLSRLASEGASGPMRASFPTKTFPNHWTLVTGLVPDQHGIVANRMQDAERPGEVFTMSTVDPWWWSDAKPIWIEAEEAGIRSASMFWPGSAVAWGGTTQRYGPIMDGEMAQDWVPFSMQFGNTQRVNTVLDWLRRPKDIRPAFVTLYFDTVDSAGHGGGIEGEQIDAALRDIDAHIAMLTTGLDELGISANLVITSDHGMAPTSSERVIAIDEVLEDGTYRMVESGAYATFEATEGQTEALETALLAEHPHMECWRKAEIPARFEYGSHPRIPPYFCLPETGWSVAKTRSDAVWTGGGHGYDPFDPAMKSLFIAHGPAFQADGHVEEFQNTAITPLLRLLIGLSNPPEGEAALSAFTGVMVAE